MGALNPTLVLMPAHSQLMNYRNIQLMETTDNNGITDFGKCVVGRSTYAGNK